MKQFYRNLNLQTKLMISYLIIISIPMLLIAGFFYGKVYNMIVADTIRSEQVNSSKTAPVVETAMDQLLADFKTICHLPFYEQLNSLPKRTLLSSLSDEVPDFADQVDELLTASDIQHFKIYLDLPESELATLAQSSSGIFESMDSTQNAYWKGIFSGSGITTLHCPEFYLNNYEKEHYGNMAYITKRNLLLDNKPVLCYTAAYYSSDIFLNVLRDNLPTAGSVSYIINDRDAIIATTSPALSSTYYLNYQTIQDSFMSSNNFLQKQVLDEDIYAGMYNIKQPGWYMVVVIPSRPLIHKSQMLMLQYLILFLLSIAGALFLAVSLSRSITQRLGLITRQMSKVRTGPPIPLEESSIHDEIGDLIDTYNYMSREMNRLLRKMEKAAEELRIAEFRSLQAQINPHFLYNTMDMINWMATQNRTAEITDAVQSLSRFYKLTLSRKESISTIAEEAEHVGIYLRLQNMRFPDAIDFVTDIPDELLDYEIPKLTLQPIAENAVLHGIMETEEKSGTIVLTGWKEEGTIVLLLSDNGIGMEPDRLKNILHEKQQPYKGNNIAVFNTHHRLQILYGEEYGLSYQSRPGEGTEVSIRIPARRKGSEFPVSSIIRIAEEKNIYTDSSLTVKSSDLPGYNDKLASDIYRLRDLHQISEKLPEHESLYILSHFVTEDFPPHNHSYYEMSYCCKGIAINRINGQDLVQHTGSLFIMHPDAVHEIKYQDEECILINFAFLPEPFSHFSSQLALTPREKDALTGGYLYFFLQYQDTLQSTLSRIVQEYADQGYHDSEEIYQMFYDFFDQLARLPRSRYGLDRHSYEILEYTMDHVAYESMDSIAAALGESGDTIAALIQKRTGYQLEALIPPLKYGVRQIK